MPCEQQSLSVLHSEENSMVKKQYVILFYYIILYEQYRKCKIDLRIETKIDSSDQYYYNLFEDFKTYIQLVVLQLYGQEINLIIRGIVHMRPSISHHVNHRNS